MGKVSIERKKTCQQCNTAFSCYTENCWCAELPLIMPLEKGKDCICPKCLEATIQQKLKISKQ